MSHGTLIENIIPLPEIGEENKREREREVEKRQLKTHAKGSGLEIHRDKDRHVNKSTSNVNQLTSIDKHVDYDYCKHHIESKQEERCVNRRNECAVQVKHYGIMWIIKRRIV